MSDTNTPSEVEVVEAGTGVSQEELERWASLSSEEQLEFFEAESRKSGMAPVSWDEALSTAVEATPEIEIQRRKAALVGVPFIISDIKINPGQWGLFVTFTAITQTPLVQGSESNAVIVNDSSKSGLAGQVVELAKKHGLQGPILIKNGLRESVYYIDNDTKKFVSKVPVANSSKAVTYYLAL